MSLLARKWLIVSTSAREKSPNMRASTVQSYAEARAAQNIGLALHELATNALAYGALSCTHGSIALSWRLEGGRFLVEWRESAVPRWLSQDGKVLVTK